MSFQIIKWRRKESPLFEPTFAGENYEIVAPLAVPFLLIPVLKYGTTKKKET